MPLLTPDIEPLWIARYDYEPHWHLPVHAHPDYFQLIQIVSGEGEAFIGPARRNFCAGQMLFLRPGLKHGLTAGAGGSVRTLDTKFLLHRANLRAACRRLPAFHAHADEYVGNLLEAIHAEARRHRRYSIEHCQTLFAQLLLRLLQNEPVASSTNLPSPADRDSGSDLAQRIERFLRENCALPVDQKMLSAALNYSYRHLHTVWLKHHHGSPLQALWQFRVARATELMRYSDYELKRIADLSGFVTVHHFSRVFSRIAGLPPARWRERERQGIRQDVAIRPGFVNRALTIQVAEANGRASAKR